MYAFVPNTYYFKPVSIEFQKTIYNSNRNVILHYYICNGINPLVGGDFFIFVILRKNVTKYLKLMVELYVSDKPKYRFFFFSFNKKDYFLTFRSIKNRKEFTLLIKSIYMQHIYLYYIYLYRTISFIILKMLKLT